MRNFTLQVTPYSNGNTLIKDLKKRLGSNINSNTLDALVFEQAISCINDFSERAKKKYSKGTTLHISKRFDMSFVSFNIELIFSHKKSFMANAIYRLRGNI